MVFSPIGPSPAADSTPEPSQLVLFDTDPNGLALLAARFGSCGFMVVATGDLGRVRELARTSTASLLLVGLHASEPGALSLMREAARLPRRHPLTCLAFGRAELRQAALDAGAVAFLPVPIFVNDVVSASRLLAGGADVVRGGQAQIAVSIPLDQLGSIYHLIRVFSVLGRSAVVEATEERASAHHPAPKTAELRFIDGALTSVDVPPWQGLAALHLILLWEHANLEVKFTKVGRRGRQLSLKPDEVLGECDRFLRDFAHGVVGLGDARTVFAPNAARRPAPQMPSEVIPVLRQFDGQRDLAQILAESPFGIFDTLRIIKRFVGDDAIVPVPTAASDAREPRRLTRFDGPAALDVWFRRLPVDGTEMDVEGGNSRSAVRLAAQAETRYSADAKMRGGAPTFMAANVSANAAAAGPSPGHGVQARDNPGTSTVPASAAAAGAGPLASNSDARRRTPHSMVATGELRMRGPTPPEPRAAVMPLRLVPGVIVDLTGEATPPPSRDGAPPAEHPDSAHRADPVGLVDLVDASNLALAEGRAPTGGQPPGPADRPTPPAPLGTSGPVRRRSGVVTQGEIRASHPKLEESYAEARREVPSVLVDLPSVGARQATRTTTAPSPVPVPVPVPEPARAPRDAVARAALAAPPAAAAPTRGPMVMPQAVPVAPRPPSKSESGRPTPAPLPVPSALSSAGRAPASGRPPHGNAFSDVEADFFNREADLYTPNAVDSFDDLDASPGHTRTGNGPRRG